MSNLKGTFILEREGEVFEAYAKACNDAGITWYNGQPLKSSGIMQDRCYAVTSDGCIIAVMPHTAVALGWRQWSPDLDACYLNTFTDSDNTEVIKKMTEFAESRSIPIIDPKLTVWGHIVNREYYVGITALHGGYTLFHGSKALFELRGCEEIGL